MRSLVGDKNNRRMNEIPQVLKLVGSVDKFTDFHIQGMQCTRARVKRVTTESNQPIVSAIKREMKRSAGKKFIKMEIFIKVYGDDTKNFELM
jgi:hypothetical protein